MEPALTLFLIAVCTVIVIDLSGFIDTLKHWVWKWAFKGKKEYQDFSLKPISSQRLCKEKKYQAPGPCLS